MHAFTRALNRRFDERIRPVLHGGGRAFSAFHVCGITGFVLAMGVAFTLVLHQGLVAWVMGAVILGAVATFFALAMATKIVLGEERLVYYHHEIAVMTVSVLLLWGLGQPVLPYLDATILGVGAFLACGRVGCLMVGCCHGRPHAWGVCYGHEHAAVGFVPYLVGVRLFPVQAAESVWVATVVVVGSVLVVGGHPPGSAFAWYVIAYDIGRFGFEFVRGDPKRAYGGGFSEGQWLSLLLMVGVVAAEAAGVLPFHAWHVAATGGMGLVMLVVSVHRKLRRVPTHRLLSARHTKEVAEALRQLMNPSTDEPQGVIRSVTTSLGVTLSAGRLPEATGTVEHVTMSSQREPMSLEAARALGGLIGRLRLAQARAELVPGRAGVFHCVLRARPPHTSSAPPPEATSDLQRREESDTGGGFPLTLRLQRG